MKKRLRLQLLVFCAIFFGLAQTAFAGATLEIDENSKINLGFRLQTLYLHSQEDLDGDGEFEDTNDFKVRRARIRLGADVTRWVSIFLQSEAAADAGTGLDMRLIDAFIQLKPSPLFNIFMGENMAPAQRENMTSSGGLLAMDRPGIVYKTLTWGTRAVDRIANATYRDSDAGLRGDVDVRDLGVTIFGHLSTSEMVHVKYYLGMYDGVQKGVSSDHERYTGRVQVNLFDNEPGYYNLATYLGKKKTVAIGASYDTQHAVARDLATGKDADYSLYSFDIFTGYPVGPGSVTFEASYINLDLDDATQLNYNGDGTSFHNAKQSQGDGYYVQAGYFWNNWQPWVEFEQWSSDAADDLGSYKSGRIGLSYFIHGHNAAIKAGYELFKADHNFTQVAQEDTIHTFATGLYVTY